MIRKLTRTALGLSICVLLTVVAANASQQSLQLRVSDGSGLEIAISTSGLVTDQIATAGGAFTSIEVPEEGFTQIVGSPRLPVIRSLVEVPQGADWTVTVESPVFSERELATPLLPLQPPQPKSGPVPPFAYDAASYGRVGYGEVPLAAIEDAGFVRGHRVAQLVLNVAAYDPSRRMVRMLESGTVRVRFLHPDLGTTQIEQERYASDPFDRVLFRTLLNGDGMDRYMPGGEIGYLAISTAAFYGNAELTSYLAWKSQKGFHVTHVSTSTIGTTKEQIKAYIQTAYDTWPIPPTFVLFVGDTPDIPHWVGIGADSPATDLNYAMLRGTDYFPDVQIGRISVTNPTELHNALTKIFSFEQVGWSGNDDWEKHATFMASSDNYTVSEGTHNYVISTYLQPLGYTSDKLYCHTYNATTQQVRDAFNAGRSQGTYSGHGAETYWADGPVFYQSDVRNLTNTVYPFIQAFTCLSNKYTVGECFGETWLRAVHGGVSYYGSSVTSYWTEDDILEKRIYQGFYDDQNPGDPVDQTWIGGMWLYGKLKYYDYFGNISMTRRYFEMYNLMGDATIDVWTAIPINPVVTAPEVLLAGQTSFDVTVAGIPYAMVSAQKSDAGNSVFVTAWTNQLGSATVNLGQALNPGTLSLTITAHNLRPYTATIQVIQPSGPYLVFESQRFDDGGGDVDATADAGETGGYFLTVKNVGQGNGTGLTGFVGTSDPNVIVVPFEANIPDLPPNGIGTTTAGLPVQFGCSIPDQSVVRFDWGAHGNEGLWGGTFDVTVQAPVLHAGSYLIDDSSPGGNSDGGADAGETLGLQLWLENSGHSDARTLTGTLSTLNPYIVIHDAEGSCPGVPVGGNGLMGSFQIEILPGCPTPVQIPFHVSLQWPSEFTASVDFILLVGSFFDDVESDQGWTCGAAGDNATTGMWVRADPVGTVAGTPSQPVQTEDDHTPDPGHICFVTGNGTVGGAAGDSDVDGGKTTLLSPVFDMEGATSATISYWRWYTNNQGNSPNEDYWDVDVTADGTNWVHLEHTTTSANSWNLYNFNLLDYVTPSSRVQLRFVASDLINASLVEAAVDDFGLDVVRPPTADVPGENSIPSGHLGIVSCQPNPFNPRMTVLWQVSKATHASLGVYDVAGRLVKSMVQGAVPAGSHSSVFDGCDANGKPLPSGIYFVRLETPELMQIRQITLLK